MSINKTNLNNNLLNRYTDKIKNCNFVIWFFKNSICLGNNYQLNTLDKLFWLWLAIIQNTRYLVSYWNNFFPSPTRYVSPFFYWLISYIFNLGFFFPLTNKKCTPFPLLIYFIFNLIFFHQRHQIYTIFIDICQDHMCLNYSNVYLNFLKIL